MDNLITLPKWENYCKDLCKSNDDYVIFDILNLNEENLDKFNFKQYANKTIILLNPDCDFPPPKETNTYKCDPKYKGLQQDCSLLTYSDKIDYRIIKIIEEFNIQILCYSSSIFHKNVRVIPLGITWQVKIPNSITSMNIDKQILCYANFGIPIDRWFGNPRQDAYNKIKNKDFILIENTQKDTSSRKMNNDYNNYFNNKETMTKVSDLKQQVFKQKESINYLINNFQETHNKQLLIDAMAIYVNELLPKVKKINLLTHQIYIKEKKYNLDKTNDNEMSLFTFPTLLTNIEHNLAEEPEVIKFKID